MVNENRRLEFDFRPREGVGRFTTFFLSIGIDESVVWPVLGEATTGLEIQVDDLLAHLTEFWKPLMLRQVFPVAVSPNRPSDLRREAENRWLEEPAADAEVEDEAVSNFEEAHDLSKAFAGVYDLPALRRERYGGYHSQTCGNRW